MTESVVEPTQISRPPERPAHEEPSLGSVPSDVARGGDIIHVKRAPIHREQFFDGRGKSNLCAAESVRSPQGPQVREAAGYALVKVIPLDTSSVYEGTITKFADSAAMAVRAEGLPAEMSLLERFWPALSSLRDKGRPTTRPSSSSVAIVIGDRFTVGSSVECEATCTRSRAILVARPLSGRG